MTNITPADRVISAFGGVRATAKIIERNPSTVSRWRKPRDEGGTGGRIPSRVQAVILAHAVKNKIPLVAADLIA